MNARFEIQGISLQTSELIHYTAIDRETEGAVEILRVFGIELSRSDFLSVSESLLMLRHPHLRSLLASELDHIDGVPWIATEVLPGICLSEVDGLGEMDLRLLAAQGMAVIDEAGEIGRDGLLFSPENIFYSLENTGLAFFSFGISPFQYQHGPNDPIQALAESMSYMAGWAGKVISADACGGLGGWVRRASAGGWPFEEARESLQVVLTQREEPIAEPVQSAPPVPQVVVAKPRGNAAMLILVSLLVVVSGGFAWFFTIGSDAREVPETSDVSLESVTPKASPPEQRPKKRVMSFQSVPSVEVSGADQVIFDLFKNHPRVKSGAAVVLMADSEEDRKTLYKNRWVILVGEVRKASKKRSLLKLEFGESSKEGKPNIVVDYKKDIDADELSVEFLKSLKGQTIAVIGQMTRRGSSRRYSINLTEREDLVQLP